jgi:hypothetical protein
MLTPQKLIWYKTSFSAEREEFVRVANDFTPKVDLRNRPLGNVVVAENQRTNLNYLRDAYSDRSNPSALSDRIWKKLENSDSWKTVTPDMVEGAIRRNTLSSGPRNVGNIIDEFNTGRIRAPIIMVYGSDRYTLIAGNTRLMVARASGVTPKVVFVRTNW